MLTINVDVYNVYISVILALHLKPNYIQRGKLVYAPHKYSSCRCADSTSGIHQKRSAVRAQAVYFLHSMMTSSWLR